MELDFLIGRKIINVETTMNDMNEHGYELTLDNGDIYDVIPNVGGCSCGAGDADITDLRQLPLDNMITNVQKSDEAEDGTYTIFIFFHEEKFDVEVDEAWSDYYGGGIEVTVKSKGVSDDV